MNAIKKIWKIWLSFSKKIGNFNLQVLMTFFYIVILLPLGVFFHFFSDPLSLELKKNQKTNFTPWSHPNENIDEARRQY